MAIKSKARHDLTLRSIKREIAAGRDVAIGWTRHTPILIMGCSPMRISERSRRWHRRIMTHWTRKKRRKRLTTAFQSSKEAKP